TDGGNVETLVRPIPVVVNRLNVEFFPEGGDLVAGIPNRVYFQARTPLGKPAELKGRIVDEAGQSVAEVQTLHDAKEPGANQGMRAFTFTPQAGGAYELKIETPAGIEGRHRIPEAKPEGVALHIPAGVTTSLEPLPVFVHNVGAERRLLVGAYCRGRLL